MSSSCSVKLSTIVDNKIGLVPNKENSTIIYEFYNYMREKGSSENHQVNNLKVVINFANFLGPDISFYNISKKEQITSFLNTKIKSSDNIDVNVSKYSFSDGVTLTIMSSVLSVSVDGLSDMTLFLSIIVL